jgi:hypothetical protein
MARQLNLELYKFLTKDTKPSNDKYYLTLSNIQDQSHKSEINQVVDSGLFSKEQFIGIDNNKKFITENNRKHPGAKWIHGNWNTILSKVDYDPALVYLDSTYFGDKDPAFNAIKKTLDICGDNALVVANVMATNPRAGLGENEFDTKQLLKNLITDEPAAKYRKWNNQNPEMTIDELENSNMYIPCYDYKASKTLMRSFIFYKGIIPSNKDFETFFAKFNENFEKEFANAK